MRCALSMLTTRRSWLMSLMVLVLGTSTSMPDCRMGAVIMKMMRRTRTTSTNGTMLISESEVCVDLTICIVILHRVWWDGREKLVKCLLDLSGDFHSEIVQALPQVTNVLQKLVVKDDRGDGRSQARSRGDQRFGDTWCDGAKAGGAGAAEASERVNDAPNRAEKADEGRYGASGGKPGHPFLDAAHFFGGSELHADRDRRQALQSRRMRIRGNAAHLRLEFAIACRIDIGEGRARGRERLRIGDPVGRAENVQELGALTADAAEHAPFLKNHGPGNEGEEKKDRKNAAGDPSGLHENFRNIGRKNRVEKKNDVPLSEREIFSGRKNRSIRTQPPQPIRCESFGF